MKVLLNAGGLQPDDPRLLAAAPDATFVLTPDEAALRREGPDADVAWGGRHFGVLLESAPHLRWVASISAGVEGYLRQLTDRPDVVLTTGSGAYDVQISEHIIALFLALQRGLPKAIRNQCESNWDRHGELGELHGGTLAIVGLGHIGLELARLAQQGFRMRVLGHKRRQLDAPPPNVDGVFYGREGLLAMLAQADFVAVTAALSGESHGLLDAVALDCLRPHVMIANIARGALIDEAEMAARLGDCRLAGAGLDVFEHEPLAADSPLWSRPNVIVTPHVAGSSRCRAERQVAVFVENLKRFARGEELRNVVDRSAGY